MPPLAALENTPDVVMLFLATKVILPPPASISPRLVLIAPLELVKEIEPGLPELSITKEAIAGLGVVPDPVVISPKARKVILPAFPKLVAVVTRPALVLISPLLEVNEIALPAAAVIFPVVIF